MLQAIDLRELSQIHGNGRDVLSAYFAGSEGLSQLNHRERQLRELLEDEPLEAENFEKSIATMRKLLEDNTVDKAEGVCIFCSEILDLARGYPISMKVPTQLIVGPAPYIRPLAELQDEYETFAVVACDNDRTRIFTVTNETAEVDQAIRGGIKNHVRKGGWSQQRYERRRDQQLLRYGKDVADVLDDLVDRHSIRRIVCIGSEETMRAIYEELPDQIQELVVGQEPFDLDRGEDALLECAYESYFEDDRDDDLDLWQRIKGKTLQGGRAVTGPGDTLARAREGRVEAALVTRDLRNKATMCRGCETVHAGVNDTCKTCGSSDVFEVDYVDALARQLELTSAELEFVDPVKGLTKVGDVAALLRY